MKIHSITLTVQDGETSDNHKIAIVAGTLFVDNDKIHEHEDGTPDTDKKGEEVKDLEKINFVTSLDENPELMKVIQALAIEALTLKNLKIAEKNGTLSHFIESVGVEEKKSGTKPSKQK